MINKLGLGGMGMEQERFLKTKKALRKIKKREEIFSRKRHLPLPTNISYHVDDEAECIIVSGDVGLVNEATHFIRFKLSGQQVFATFGYQSKIPVTEGRFQFEVQRAALLDQDYVEIQLYNDNKQYSDRAICMYEKVPSVQEVHAQQASQEANRLSRMDKFKPQKKQ